MIPFLLARALTGLQQSAPSAGAPSEPSLVARTSRGLSEPEWRAAMRDMLLYGGEEPPITQTILGGLNAINTLGGKPQSRARSIPRKAYRGAVGPPTQHPTNRPFWLTTSGERAGFFAQKQAGMSPHWQADLASETAGMVGNPQVQQWALSPSRPKVYTQAAYHKAMAGARSRSRTGQEELHAALAKQGHDIVYIKNDDGTWDMAVLRPDAIKPRPFGRERPTQDFQAFHGSPKTNLTAISASPPKRQFDNATSVFGAFFTPDAQDAQRYSGKTGRVYKTTVSLSKPYEMAWREFAAFQDVKPTTVDDMKRQIENLKSAALKRRIELENNGYDGIVVRNRSGMPIEIASFKDVPIK